MTITKSAVKKNTRKSFWVESAKEMIGVDAETTQEAVNQLSIILESELEESVSSTWPTFGPKVKSIKGTTNGKEGKDGKNRDDSKGGKGGKDCRRAKLNRAVFYGD